MDDRPLISPRGWRGPGARPRPVGRTFQPRFWIAIATLAGFTTILCLYTGGR